MAAPKATGFAGGTRLARLLPLAAIQQPVAVAAGERFIVRVDGHARYYAPAVPAVALPTGARWEFQAGEGVLRVALNCPPAPVVPAGYVGLLCEPGDLFVDRLRTRPWRHLHPPGRVVRAARPATLPTLPALTGERFVEPRGLVWLSAADVLVAESGGSPPVRWFEIVWTEPDLDEAVSRLRDCAETNAILLTDRLAATVAGELLGPSAPGVFPIALSDDLPPEQGVAVLAVTRHGRRLRAPDELGDWDAPLFRVETTGHLPGLLARLHCPPDIANPFIEIVRYPTTWPVEPQWPLVADSINDGPLAAAELRGPLYGLIPPHYGLHRAEALRRALAEYTRYDLSRLAAGSPECTDPVFWPSARGLRAVQPLAIRLRAGHRLSARDLLDLAADLGEYLNYHLEGPLHYHCQVKEEPREL